MPFRNCKTSRKGLLKRYFSDGLLDCILVWKDGRNRLIYALLKQQLGHNEIYGLAQQGESLADELRNRVGNYNRSIDRRKAKDQIV